VYSGTLLPPAAVRRRYTRHNRCIPEDPRKTTENRHHTSLRTVYSGRPQPATERRHPRPAGNTAYSVQKPPAGKLNFPSKPLTKVNQTKKYLRKWTQRYEKIARETMKIRENTDTENNFLWKS